MSILLLAGCTVEATWDGERQRDKRLFIWGSCIEHHVRIRHRDTKKNYFNHADLLLFKSHNVFQVEHARAAPLYVISWTLRTFYCC